MTKMKVRLTRKLAEQLDGIDLTACAVGDILTLPERQALCLISEGWAIPETSGDASAGPGRGLRVFAPYTERG